MRGDAAPVYGESGRPKSQRASRLSSGLEVRVGDLALDYGGFHSTVLVYFRDRLEEKTAERMIFDGIVQLLVELGLVKKKGKQRLDSTHIVGYVKAMSWMECALETLRLGLEDLACDAGTKKRPEFWSRLWEIYVESNLDWRLSKTEQGERRACRPLHYRDVHHRSGPGRDGRFNRGAQNRTRAP